MKFGIVLPQGLTGEYAGWEPARAWARTLALAQEAESLGFESVWVFDHLGTFENLRDEPTFEAFAVLGALATATQRVRIGPMVARAGLRNPALLAKLASTLDVISGGRFELGLGAGGPAEDAVAFGYDAPAIGERLALLGETLELVRALFTDGRATYNGRRVRVDDALDNPRGLQAPRIPLIVGGNGRTTWRLAAQFADELNLDGPTPAATHDALAVIREICGDVWRDPDSLAVSVHVVAEAIHASGAERVDLLGAYRETGVRRLVTLLPEATTDEALLASLAADARAAGLALD